MAGTIKTNAVQLGDSATATQNFTLHGFTQQDIQALFVYEDGLLFNRVHRATTAKEGAEAGYISNLNYRLVAVDGKTFGVHRAIFFLHYGYVPEIVDHINGNTLDNRIGNLRAATKAHNTQNAVVRTDSSTGVKGVTYSKEAGSFTSRVQVGKSRKFLGYFATLEDASEFTQLAREMLHGAFANHGNGCIATGV